MALSALLAHAGGVDVGSGGATVMTIMLVGVLLVVWVALGVVCWLFWRAKKRDEAERKGTGWRNAPSS